MKLAGSVRRLKRSHTQASYVRETFLPLYSRSLAQARNLGVRVYFDMIRHFEKEISPGLGSGHEKYLVRDEEYVGIKSGGDCFNEHFGTLGSS